MFINGQYRNFLKMVGDLLNRQARRIANSPYKIIELWYRFRKSL